ncbi:hypothetical protein FACS189450_11290 [Spirochaetia bacterium]|nr:hypothetical protein FACS189450_11290 [Spirochaetia bacterium]
MKKLFAFIFMGLAVIMLTGTSFYEPTYGGVVQIHNDLSFDLYIEIDTIPINGLPYQSDGFGIFYLEKNKTVEFIHISDEQNAWANPNNAYAIIHVFNVLDGTLVKEITVSEATFIKVAGSINDGNAIFYLDLTSAVLGEAGK